MARLLSAKGYVSKKKVEIGGRIDACANAGVEPRLALVRLGDRLDDKSYERSVIKRAVEVGLTVESTVLPAGSTQADLMREMAGISADARIHGCLMFRPLSREYDEKAVSAALDPAKDVDGMTVGSLASVFADDTVGFPPCTAESCMEMLDHHGIEIEGKHVVVIGRSLVIGKPVAMMMLKRDATVTVCHSRTRDLEEIARRADIVVCASGRARAYGPSYFSPGQVVLDVGINFTDKGKICGDVDFEAVEPIVAAITPVPGGIGSMTTLVTFEHTVEAAEAALAKLNSQQQ